MTNPLLDSLRSLLGPAYEVRREIPGGGMSRVFLAHDIALQRDVVVKVLPPDLLSRDSVTRFTREVEVTARLQHPHILPVISAGGNERLRYYVMPYVAGGSLRDQLQTRKLLEFSHAVRLSGELLAAVSVAHERGIVHRDIKPGNVLFSAGHAILADFGIARVKQSIQESDTTASTSVASPEAYRAPENPTGAAADLYAVAVLSYEMLTGTLPARNPSESAVTGAVLDAHPRALPEHVRAVARALSRALSADPASRFPTAAEFRSALLEHEPRPRFVRRRTVAAATAAAVGGLAWLLGSARPVVPTPRDFAHGDTAIAPVAALISSATSPVSMASHAAAPEQDATDAAPRLSVLDAAQRARERGAVDSARSMLERVPRHDAQYGRAQLRLATLDAWIPALTRIDAAARAALRALDAGGLDPRETQLARGIAALGAADYPRACDAFGVALAHDADFDAWMGAAECRYRDTTVLVDATGEPRFRSSYFEAARAYVEAGRRAGPGDPAIAFERLPHVAFTERARVRRGWTADGRLYLGQAIGVADSFTFEVFPAGPRRITPEFVQANVRAVELARGMLRPALVAWVQREPTNVRARVRLVELLEASGNIREPGRDGLTAADEVVAARALPMARFDALRLAHTHTRILLRSRDFAGAARLADSLLAANPDPSVQEAELLVSLAFLTGKVDRAQRLLEQVSGAPLRQIRLPDGRSLEVPPTMVRERATFVTKATLGVCNEGVRTAPERLSNMLDALFPDGTRPNGVESAFLERPMVLAYDCIGREGGRVLDRPMNPLAQALFAPSDAARAHWLALLDQVNASRAAGGMFDASESALAEAMVHLTVGDTSRAFAVLQRVIDALPALPNAQLNNEVLAGTLPRVMALAARLAAATGDTSAATLSSAVVDLWRHADPALQDVVERMREIRAQSED